MNGSRRLSWLLAAVLVVGVFAIYAQVRGFALLQTLFPAECANELHDAQRLYVDMIDYLDERESQFKSRVAVFESLAAARSGWRSENGSLIFSDRRLESRVTFLQRSGKSKDEAVKRWTRDFGSVNGL